MQSWVPPAWSATVLIWGDPLEGGLAGAEEGQLVPLAHHCYCGGLSSPVGQKRWLFFFPHNQDNYTTAGKLD